MGVISAGDCAFGREAVAEAAPFVAATSAVDKKAPVIRVSCKAREGAHIRTIVRGGCVGEEGSVQPLLPQAGPLPGLLSHVRRQKLDLSWLDAVADGLDGPIV